jgi:hypothetical protein
MTRRWQLIMKNTIADENDSKKLKRAIENRKTNLKMRKTTFKKQKLK